MEGQQNDLSVVILTILQSQKQLSNRRISKESFRPIRKLHNILAYFKRIK